MNTTMECLWLISYSIESYHGIVCLYKAIAPMTIIYCIIQFLISSHSYASYMHCLVHNIGIMKAFLTENQPINW